MSTVQKHEVRPLLVDQRTACTMLSCSRATLYRLIAARKLGRPLKIGRMVRFEVAEIIDYVGRVKAESQQPEWD